MTLGSLADPPADSAPQPVKDAWIEGRLETAYALNQKLGEFELDVAVEKGVVRLSGTLENEIARDLAMEIATGVEGVRDVKSTVTVQPGARRPTGLVGDESFTQRVSDATTTARVKSNLVANGNTKGLSIDVDTEKDVVTLTGAVPSRREKMLAEMIARNTDGIASVRNQIEIEEQTRTNRGEPYAHQ